MKNIFKTMLAIAILVQACKKNDNASPASVPTGTLKFHIHTNIDTSEVEINSGNAYRTSNGKRITLDRVRYYISGIKAYKSDGTYQILTNDTTMLITAGSEQYTAGQLPSGNYNYVAFNIGIDASSNKKSPDSFKATDSRSAKTPSMYFNNSLGYVFMDIAGRADTSVSGNDSLSMPFTYQIGTDANLVTIKLEKQAFSLITGKQWEVHLKADFGKLLEETNFKTQTSSTPSSNPAYQNTLASKLSGLFKYEE